MTTRRAFTLTEMVVTVSIASLAGGLMVPSVVQVRDQSQAAVCMANQTAIIRALHNYHVDHDVFPYNYADYDMVHAIMPTESLSRSQVQSELYVCYKRQYGSLTRNIKGFFSRNKLERTMYRHMASQSVLRNLRDLI